MRVDEGNFLKRFVKQLLFFSAIAVPIFAVVFAGWRLGEWVANTTGHGWLEAPIGLATVCVVFAALQAAFQRDRG